MPENLDDISIIRHVQDGDPVAGLVTSQPTRAIEQRLRALESLVDSLSSGVANPGNLVIPNVSIDPSVIVNRIVFYNSATGNYELALAGVTLMSNIFTSNSTSLAIGYVLSVNGSIANVMVGGYLPWVTDIWMGGLLVDGETFQAGLPLYLSDVQPGKLTRFPPTLRIQVMVATGAHFILMPSFSSPEAIENIFKCDIGMRPVGAVRQVPPDYTRSIIVGFDALENYSSFLWRSTKDSSVTNHQLFGYMIADMAFGAAVAAPSPFYVKIKVAAGGVITAYSAPTLAQLIDGGGDIFNVVTSLTALSGNPATVRGYVVTDALSNILGTLSFKFTDADTTKTR